MSYRVVPPDPAWPIMYSEEAERLRNALAPLPAVVHHIGSTAIPGIHAKPIIDILLEVDDPRALDHHVASFEALGYVALGEYGIPGRRFYRKDSPAGLRTHHIHAFERGSAGSIRHLAFRDYMRVHPEIAHAYGALKQTLALRHPEDIEAYMDGKDAFIKLHEQRALREIKS
jgi:GrpB-like predicted nucleotidyltransferase (UPF0157 family)